MIFDGEELLRKLSYDNIYFPFEDCFRQDRLIAYSHKTHNVIVITKTPYLFKYNEKTNKVLRLTNLEYKAIDRIKLKLDWPQSEINYLLKNTEKEYKDDKHKI